MPAMHDYRTCLILKYSFKIKYYKKIFYRDIKIFNKIPQLLLLLMDRFQQISTYMKDI